MSRIDIGSRVVVVAHDVGLTVERTLLGARGIVVELPRNRGYVRVALDRLPTLPALLHHESLAPESR